ncbi:MAG: hypothetical protein JNM18_07225 [Planctomycetaceae bacterium]|nr:hypothetical protein [Planctomycetaceae bacterium]
MSLALTDRDLDLLATLTLRVRMLALVHCGELGWSDLRNLAPTVKRLERLAKAGLIESHLINARPLLPTEQPLVAWRPGDGPIDAERISQQTQARWNAAAHPLTVYVATSRTACLYGGTVRGLPPMERRDHELRLASVYVHYRRRLPTEAIGWISIPDLPITDERTKGFDACIHDDNGRFVRIVHCAGRYGPEHVERLHQRCQAHDLPYELW